MFFCCVLLCHVHCFFHWFSRWATISCCTCDFCFVVFVLSTCIAFLIGPTAGPPLVANCVVFSAATHWNSGALTIFFVKASCCPSHTCKSQRPVACTGQGGVCIQSVLSRTKRSLNSQTEVQTNGSKTEKQKNK